MSSGLPEQWYEKAVADLETAYDELFQGTPNQQGMPDHFRDVASQFGEVKELIGKLEQYALDSARDWEKKLSGNTNNYNNYNSNATMPVNGGRRRKTRKTRNRRRKN